MLYFPCSVRAFCSVQILCHWLIQLPFYLLFVSTLEYLTSPSTSAAQSLPAVQFTCCSNQSPPLPLFQLTHPSPEHEMTVVSVQVH